MQIRKPLKYIRLPLDYFNHEMNIESILRMLSFINVLLITGVVR